MVREGFLEKVILNISAVKLLRVFSAGSFVVATKEEFH